MPCTHFSLLLCVRVCGKRSLRVMSMYVCEKEFACHGYVYDRETVCVDFVWRWCVMRVCNLCVVSLRVMSMCEYV